MGPNNRSLTEAICAPAQHRKNLVSLTARNSSALHCQSSEPCWRHRQSWGAAGRKEGGRGRVWASPFKVALLAVRVAVTPPCCASRRNPSHPHLASARHSGNKLVPQAALCQLTQRTTAASPAKVGSRGVHTHPHMPSCPPICTATLPACPPAPCRRACPGRSTCAQSPACRRAAGAGLCGCRRSRPAPA